MSQGQVRNGIWKPDVSGHRDEWENVGHGIWELAKYYREEIVPGHDCGHCFRQAGMESTVDHFDALRVTAVGELTSS